MKRGTSITPPKALPVTAEGVSLYQLLVESVRDYAIFALDPKGHIITWNTGAERFKGYKREEILGKHFSLLPPEEADTKPSMGSRSRRETAGRG